MPETGALIFADLERQAAWVPDEVARIVSSARDNADGFGVHKTTVEALAVLMEELTRRVNVALDAVRGATDGAARRAATQQFAAQLGARAEVWQVFRAAFAMRRDPKLRESLDLADLVAARAYKALQEKADGWGKLQGWRAPPLVVLRASPGVAAVGAGNALKTLSDAGFALRRLRDEPLPIPIVLLSAEYCGSAWRLVALFHEVGHLFDRDVPVSDELKARSATATTLPAGLPGPTLRLWTEEIVADVIGVGLGGQAFLSSLTCDLLASLAASDAPGDDPHPNPWVRVPLLLAIADALGITVPDEARALWRSADALARPAWFAAYEPHLDALARFFVATKLDALGGHTLGELSRSWGAVEGWLAKLTRYFAGAASTASRALIVDGDGQSAHDLVPIAAERCRLATDTQLDALHQDALSVARDRLLRPQWLAAHGLRDPLAHWRALASAYQPLSPPAGAGA